ncbi:hypothetical protein ACTXT7_007655 [Hymenolepis weldensis]
MSIRVRTGSVNVKGYRIENKRPSWYNDYFHLQQHRLVVGYVSGSGILLAYIAPVLVCGLESASISMGEIAILAYFDFLTRNSSSMKVRTSDNHLPYQTPFSYATRYECFPSIESINFGTYPEVMQLRCRYRCPIKLSVVCYCGRQDEVVRCGSVEAKRYSLFELHTVYEGDLELCDVEMFFKGTDEEKSALLATPNGSLTALFVGTVFSCEQRCDRPLTCEHHSCMDICHPGECKSCPLLPENCVTCPCGRVPLSKLVLPITKLFVNPEISESCCTLSPKAGYCLNASTRVKYKRAVMNGNIHGNRRSCIDPIPLCPNICERPNPICGHPCPEKCHQGPECPPCKLTTQINCRCGKSSKEIPCYEYALAVKNDPTSIQFLCNRVCAKKKTCGRHKCNRKCCDGASEDTSGTSRKRKMKPLMVKT